MVGISPIPLAPKGLWRLGVAVLSTMFVWLMRQRVNKSGSRQ